MNCDVHVHSDVRVLNASDDSNFYQQNLEIASLV